MKEMGTFVTYCSEICGILSLLFEEKILAGVALAIHHKSIGLNWSHFVYIHPLKFFGCCCSLLSEGNNHKLPLIL